MNYSLITERELFKRFNSLPESIQNMLEREANHQIIERVCQNHHLIDEEKVLMVKQLAGLVLFGFIHAEDLGQEINEALELNNPRLAASIADEISRKIFSSIRDDLDRIYAPAGEEPSYAAPKMMEEIRRTPEPTGQDVPSPTSPIREPETSFEENPIILHEEAEFEPGKPSAGFKLEAPTPKFEESQEKFTPPMRPARLEIGGEPVPTPTPPQPRPPAEETKVINYTDLRTPLMSPEQELPAPQGTGLYPAPPQPAKEINIRAEEIKTRTEIPEPPPPFKPMPIPKKGGWIKSLFSPRPKKEIVFAPRVISEEELKREALTIRASMPKPPPPPAGGPQPIQKPTKGPSVFEEVVDLSTLTRTKKPFPPPDSGNPPDNTDNTVNLKPKT